MPVPSDEVLEMVDRLTAQLAEDFPEHDLSYFDHDFLVSVASKPGTVRALEGGCVGSGRRFSSVPASAYIWARASAFAACRLASNCVGGRARAHVRGRVVTPDAGCARVCFEPDRPRWHGTYACSAGAGYTKTSSA